MNRSLALALAALLAASPAAAQTEPAPIDATLPNGPEILLADEAVEGTTVRRGVSRFTVRAPMSVVAREFTDFGNYTQIIPRVAESRVVRRTRAGTEVYMQVRLGQNLGVLWSRLRLSVRRTAAAVEVSGTSIEGNVDRFELATRIEPMPDDPERTLITCRMLSVPQLPFPSSVFTRENRAALSTLANRLRTRVEGATQPPAQPAQPAQPPVTAAATAAAPSS